MAKIGKRSVGLALTAILTLTTISTTIHSLNQVSVVQAASKNLNTTKAKLNHLYKSLHTNYLGIKNQETWEGYIKELRGLINKIPSSEKAEAQRIAEAVNKADDLVKAVARINHVEKSMEKNAKIMKNVKTWDAYLQLGDRFLSRVDKKEFSKEISNISARSDKSKKIVSDIQADYDVKYEAALDLFNTALESGSTEDAQKAHDAAVALPRCSDTEELKYHARIQLSEVGVVELSSDEEILYAAMEKLDSMDEVLNTDDNSAASIEKAAKAYLGMDVTVKASILGEDHATNFVIFDINLSKGKATAYPITFHTVDE